jgi:maltose O-acetyltransferase
MRSEKLKMLAGEPYDASDAQLTEERARARVLCEQLNHLPTGANAEVAQLLAALFGKPVRANIAPPFHCDYGTNIALGDAVYFNCNCVILDVARVSIGANTLLGPGVHVYAATHPMSFEERRAGLESGKPVSIGDDVWVGGGAIVCPGVTIGAGAVIGAGSVVTRDVPPRVLAAGNPCRVIRRL